MEDMTVYKRVFSQQFRDADADAYVGLRGYMNFFQDAAASYMYRLGWGNDRLYKTYGVAWVYLKYKMHVFKKVVYEPMLDVECWVEQSRYAAGVRQALEIKQAGETVALGRLESALIDPERQRLTRLDSIGYNRDLALDRYVDLEDYERISKEIGDAQPVYTHVVRYSDLDNNHHVNNLRYIPMVMDVFSPEEFKENMITDFEIHYVGQCFFGETLDIYRIPEEGRERVLVVKEDKTVAAMALVTLGTLVTQ